jgi:hypothetical protein
MNTIPPIFNTPFLWSVYVNPLVNPGFWRLFNDEHPILVELSQPIGSREVDIPELYLAEARAVPPKVEG